MKIPNKIQVIFCSFLSIFFRSRTIKHILKLNGTEKKEFLTKIINENIKYKNNEKQEVSFVKYNSFKFIESYNQLPCTIETRKKRADLLEKNGFRDKEILLIGDDDLLSVELVARNFRHITVLDCDLKLLNKLRILTQEAKYPVNYFHVDLYEGFPKFLNHIFDVVCFDPPQNYEDLNKFMSCAIQSLKNQNSIFYMMVNSSALGLNNTDRLFAELLKYGFVNTNKYEFFNCYPLNKGQSLLLSIMAKFTHPNLKTIKCNYYFSDCLEFKSVQVVQNVEQFSDGKKLLTNILPHYSIPEIPIAFYNNYKIQNKKTMN
ncbi:bis-aminopropyl spermidine synthase family protein [Silvanigrella sp.]|jgi:predicted methyltransferase|uniref:bis-aminopropyl spermidine synthase family protein n=1 Tax=Silvanigrella sp. TaxID=2024976 RepID=UPI0037C6E00E